VHLAPQGTGGECGLRGGYVELANIHPGAVEEMYKIASINLSPNTIGQIAMSCLINPPKPGQESYEQWSKERTAELASLRRRAHMVTDAFNAMENVTCNFTEGAMYAFPQVRAAGRARRRRVVQGEQCWLACCDDVRPADRLLWLCAPVAGVSLLASCCCNACSCHGCLATTSSAPAALASHHPSTEPPPALPPSCPQLQLPAKAIAAAKAAGKAPDVFYCLRLLESTGISTVPGSGFGQAEGTFHLRTTILPREEAMQKFCDKFRNFHEGFMNQYR
jgi:aspartate/methionine/tyrosine aminotransferase